MSNAIEADQDKLSFFEPITLGSMPTVATALAKSNLPKSGKVASLAATALATAVLTLQAPDHQHPSVFCHPETKKPFKQGDLITITDLSGNRSTKMVVGYTGHHHTVFDNHAVEKDPEGNILAAKMDSKTLWTGPYKLIASTYAAMPSAKAGLVVAEAENLQEVYKFDVSGDGPFQSSDAGQALAVSIKGQQLLNVQVLKPTTLDKENQTGVDARITRLVSSLKKSPSQAINPSVLGLAQYVTNPGSMNPLDFS